MIRPVVAATKCGKQRRWKMLHRRPPASHLRERRRSLPSSGSQRAAVPPTASCSARSATPRPITLPRRRRSTPRCGRYQKLPAPILFACEGQRPGHLGEDPDGWIAERFSHQPGLDYFFADGLDLATGHAQVQAAVEHCRRTRRPTFLHLRTTRLMGHAGTGFEVEWRALPELCAAEAGSAAALGADRTGVGMDAAASRRPTRRCVRCMAAAWG